MTDMSTINTTGVLHFTISVRDHIKSAEYYRDLLGCKLDRASDHFAFMRCGKDYFVLAKMADHVNPNPPGGTKVHHAFMVEPKEFDRALEIIKARGIEILKYEDVNQGGEGRRGHRSFPGRHVYFHDPDANCIEIIDLRLNETQA
jgi:catechol 2,3-dioxygenase-like lactoylglutathione lyase family enzyme